MRQGRAVPGPAELVDARVGDVGGHVLSARDEERLRGRSVQHHHRCRDRAEDDRIIWQLPYVLYQTLEHAKQFGT